MTIIEELSAYAAEQARARLTPAVAHAAKRPLVDWVAALLPGTRVQPGLTLVQSHAEELGLGRSSLPGFGTTALPATAAWINGSVSHAIEFDDKWARTVQQSGAKAE